MELKRDRLLVATRDEDFFGNFASVVMTDFRGVERVDLSMLPVKMTEEQWDLVIVDLDGASHCRDFVPALPPASRTAVIVVVDDDDAGIECLQYGVDDYVRKPVSMSELAARAAARLGNRPQGEASLFGDFTIDRKARVLRLAGRDVDLAPIEFDLLAFLASRPNVTFSRAQLLAEVWGSAASWQDAGTVTEHIYRLRHKIEPDAVRPQHLITVRSIGYRFQP